MNKKIKNQKLKKSAGEHKADTKNKKNKKNLKEDLRSDIFSQKNESKNIENDLEILTKDLIYISETDAYIFPFIGTFANEVSAESLFTQISVDSSVEYEITRFEDFFRHPSKIQEWFNEKRITKAKQYLALKNLMEDKLTDIKVFKVGNLNLDIYVVGLDSERKLMGIKTKATET